MHTNRYIIRDVFGLKIKRTEIESDRRLKNVCMKRERERDRTRQIEIKVLSRIYAKESEGQ